MFGADRRRDAAVLVLHEDQARPLRMALPQAHQAIGALHRALAGEVEIRALLGDRAFVPIVAIETDVGRLAAERAKQVARVGWSWPTRSRCPSRSDDRDCRTIRDSAPRR